MIFLSYYIPYLDEQIHRKDKNCSQMTKFSYILFWAMKEFWKVGNFVDDNRNDL